MSAPKGSCLCQAVQFTLEGEAGNCLVCHCTDCRKNSGHTGQMIALFETEKVHFQGTEDKMKYFTVNDTQSGVPKRKYFCGECGCTIMTMPMKYEGKKVFIRPTLLDQGLENFVPKKDLFAEKKLNLDVAAPAV